MPWIAPVLAYVDGLGYMYCVACRPNGPGDPVYGDTYFIEEDACERCGKYLEHVPVDEYVHVEWPQTQNASGGLRSGGAPDVYCTPSIYACVG